MLNNFKRWISGGPTGPDLHVIAEWAKGQSLDFKKVREGDGFALDGALDGVPWRLEWGPPQRRYIEGRELRIRMELDLPHDMQMLIIDRSLMERLERDAFEQFTQSTQTVIDNANPEEMRWLAMFPKASLAAYKSLRTRFGAVAPSPRFAIKWIEGALAAHLEIFAAENVAPDIPFVLMTLRGRLYLRQQALLPTPDSMARLVKLFCVAAQQARRLAALNPDGLGEELSTAPAAWTDVTGSTDSSRH